MAAGNDVARLVSVNVAEGIRDAYRRLGNQAGVALRGFVAGMEVGAKEDMRRVHVAIASEMRTEIMQRYAETVEAQKRVPSYRRTNRLSGHLSRMLRRRDLVRATSDGIDFINANAMDKEAAHWRRLNFGAGDVAGDQPGPYPIRLFGEAVLQVGFNEGPSAPFLLPKGFFLHNNRAQVPNSGYRGAGSVAPFQPSRRSGYRPQVTVGIRGRHFLEAGFEVMEREFPVRYANLLNKWIQDGGKKARAIARATG